jgi:hypothetical protein
MAHHRDGEGCAFAGDASAHDELDGFIFQNTALVFDTFGLRIFFDKPVKQSARRVKRYEFGALGKQAVNLPKDVTVIDPDYGKTDYIHGNGDQSL